MGPSDESLPRELGRYTLLRPLGEGGQGRVIAATQRLPGGETRAVAVKLLTGEGDALWREARMAALLRHPHLVDVYEVGRSEGRWYCAMELCPGGSLEGRAPLPLRAVVEVGLQVCDALAYAHDELELVHLDLKPANLLVRDGAVKVADLGIATARGFAGDGRIRGTPRYMSPEQRLGLPVDPRADVYALGWVLAELAGAPLEPAETVAVPVEDDRPRPPARLPEALDRVVRRCVEPDAVDRYPDLRALAEALRQLSLTGPGLHEVLGGGGEDESARDSVAPVWVGREALLDAVSSALAPPGLVTLKGPAGIGKSALARELARRAGGVVVDLDAARSVDEAVGRVAEALAVPLTGGLDPTDRVGDALAARGGLLVVLDGVEHLAGRADVLRRWRERAPGGRLLATSRSACGVSGERLVEVGPLGAGEAAALVVAHARRRGVEPDAAAVEELVRRLDGVPLALELAAQRLGVLTTADVLERLDLSLLRSGTLGLPPRQATVRGALDWSWALLGERERATLARIAVFRGRFAADDAARVLDDDDPLDALQALVDHSLVATADLGHRLLAPIAEYAAERLRERGEEAEIELRHARWFARHGHPDALAETGPAGERAMRRRAAHLPDLVVAARRAAARGEARVAERCALAAAAVLRVRGPVGEGVSLLTEVAAAVPVTARVRVALARLALDAGDPALALRELAGADAEATDDATRVEADLTRGDLERARAAPDAAVTFQRRALERCEAAGRPTGRAWLGLCASRLDLGDLDGAEDAGRRAIEALRRAGDREAEASALADVAVALRRRGRLEEARALLARARDLDEQLDLPVSLASDQANLAILDAHAGRTEEALAGFEASVRGFAACGLRAAAAQQSSNLAELLLHVGRREEARDHARRALAVHEELGHGRLAGHTLHLLATAEATEGRLDEARALFERALGRYREVGATVPAGVARTELAALALRVGDPAGALATVERALGELGEHRVERATALAVRGEARAALGLPGAEDDLRAATALLRATSPAVLPRVLCAAARALGDASLLDELDGAALPPGSFLAEEVARTLALLGR